MTAKFEDALKASETTTPVPVPRAVPVVADELVAAFTGQTKLDAAAATKLKELIVKALDERFLETQDVRLGKVLGSALATL